MKIGKHTSFLINYISNFADSKISRFDFELDYSGYVIEHFPAMERENAHLARKFANTIDITYENAVNGNVSDDNFRILMNNALCDWIGTDKSDLL